MNKISFDNKKNFNAEDIFITDLDGTFLNKNKVVSEKSVEIINRLINNGLKFSIATARTPATVTEIMKDIELKLPVICMNGSAIYDIKNNRYVNYHKLDNTAFNELVKIFNKNNSSAFVYTIKNDFLNVFYKEINNKPLMDFYEERKNLKHKKFIKGSVNDEEIIFLMLLDKTEIIEKIYKEIINSSFLDKITLTKYKDIYSEEDYSYLEIYDKNASKKTGVNFLKKYSNSQKLIVFGDNANDISMLEEADFSVAVGNATNEVKNIADKVIGTNNDDSVAKEIENIYVYGL